MTTAHQAIVTVLGSGTCVPSLTRSSSAVLISLDRFNILVDIGVGTMHRLLAAGKTIFDIDLILLTHFHPDHSGELISFLFSTKYATMRPRTRPLTLVGGIGLKAFYNGLHHVYGAWIELEPTLFRIEELSNQQADAIDFHDTVVRSIPVAHNPESLAFRIEAPNGASIVLSGDTGYSENLVELARAADLFICEAALPDAYKVDNHLTPSEAGRIATLAGVKKLVLTHFYPQCDAADMVQECRQTFAGPLRLAEDLQTHDLDLRQNAPHSPQGP